MVLAAIYILVVLFYSIYLTPQSMNWSMIIALYNRENDYNLSLVVIFYITKLFYNFFSRDKNWAFLLQQPKYVLIKMLVHKPVVVVVVVDSKSK